MDFSIEDKNIRFGLLSIKGISEKSIEKLNNFKNNYSTKFEVFEGAKESGLTIGILSALIQAGTFEGFQISRSKIVYEAQLWNILTKKEKAAALSMAQKFDFDLVEIVKSLSNKKDDKGKAMVKDTRLKTIKKKSEPYKQIYFKNNFITEIIDSDISGNYGSNIHTRFPPEPNGYLHIGHAKSIYINFSIAEKYNGKCNLRFDDTNPSKENVEYVNSFIEDIKWLGFNWAKSPLYASDYFDQMYDLAIILIKQGKAYVDDQSSEKIKSSRGTLNAPGINSPFRTRSIKENLELFI